MPLAWWMQKVRQINANKAIPNSVGVGLPGPSSRAELVYTFKLQKISSPLHARVKKKKSDQLSRQVEAGLMIKRSKKDSISGLWELLLCNPNVKGIPLLFPLKRASPSGQTPKACIFHSNASFRSLRAQWSKCQEKNGGFQLTCLKCLAGALTAAAAAWQLSCLVGESSSSLGRRSCGQPQAPHTGA